MSDAFFSIIIFIFSFIFIHSFIFSIISAPSLTRCHGCAANTALTSSIGHGRHAGQHLLIATAAAEEGLNIPACQFVIRFNATQTGEMASQRVCANEPPGTASGARR